MADSSRLCDLCRALLGRPIFEEPHPALVLAESLPIEGPDAPPGRRDRYRCTRCDSYWTREVVRFESDSVWMLAGQPTGS